MKKDKSPYSAAFTGCSFMMYEMNRMLPLFLAENPDELIRQEIEDNHILMVNSVASRKKYALELKRRFESVPRQYWEDYKDWNESEQRLGLLYVLLRTYRIVLDFHLNVTLRKWNSIDHRLFFDDVAMELSQIAANDTFVDSWSDNTKNRVASAYLTFLSQSGIYDKKSLELHHASNVGNSFYAYFLCKGQDWFLEACLLYPYEIEQVKLYAL